MSAILFGVPGKLKTLLARIPTNNTTIMGRINDTISSRAPAGTAVSNAVLTPGRSALLDNLDAPISGLATGQGFIVGVITGAPNYASMIKTFYTVSVSKSGGGLAYSGYFNGTNANTPAVNPAKTILYPLSYAGGGGSSLPVATYEFKLWTDNKRVQFRVNTNYVTGTYDAVVLVVEYN